MGALLPLMWTLAIAKLSGDLISPSFDHGMMNLRRLAYLEEEPPHEFEMLTTRDVMARNVIVLKEVLPQAPIYPQPPQLRHPSIPTPKFLGNPYIVTSNPHFTPSPYLHPATVPSRSPSHAPAFSRPYCLPPPIFLSKRVNPTLRRVR